jgi:hypothetical protein
MVEVRRCTTFILSAPGFWIDLLLLDLGWGLGVQFRVAVTNPDSVVALLYELLNGLSNRFGGHVMGAPGRRRLDEGNLLDSLAIEFAAARFRFTQDFGEVILPVSGDEVFSRLRISPRP